MKIFQTLLDLIFPRKCLICNKNLQYPKIERQNFLCQTCSQKLIFNNKIIHSKEYSFAKAYAVYEFNEITKKLIHEFKYNEMRNIGVFLGRKAAEFIQKQKDFPKIDYVIPVPLHKTKKRARGFNQAEIISREIAEICHLNHLPKGIDRIRFTETQTILGKIERNKNVSNAFDLKKGTKLERKTILLIDDVFTTGATVNTISNVLENNGVNQIIVLTIARA